MAEWGVGRRFSGKIRAMGGCMLQNPVKSLHEGHQLNLILAFVACVVLQVGTLQTGLEDFLVILSLMVLDLLVCQYSTRSRNSDLESYLRTGVLVLEDYALLIFLNRKYIEIAIIPFVMLAFIGALAIKGRMLKSAEATESTRLTLPFMAIAYVPCMLQLMLVISTQYKRQVEDGNIFILTSFLLFLGSALSALTMMVDSPPIRGSPGVNQVLPTMQKTCIVMLMMTSHSMAAEWLWEDMVFAFMPELTLVLSWCTIYCYHPEHVVSINRSLVIILSSVGAILLLFLAYMYVQDRIILRSLFVRVLCIFTSSSALSCLDVWLLHEWPAGSTPNFKGGLVQLLKVSSLISSCVSACIAAALILPLISIVYQLMLPEAWTMLAMFLGSLPWLGENHQTKKYLDQITSAYTASNRYEVVVAIIGLGRCKKTVASHVYESIKSKFDCHVSVKVGPNLDMAQLIRNMIKQVDSEYKVITCDAADDVNQLTRSLWELFQGKRVGGSHVNPPNSSVTATEPELGKIGTLTSILVEREKKLLDAFDEGLKHANGDIIVIERILEQRDVMNLKSNLEGGDVDQLVVHQRDEDVQQCIDGEDWHSQQDRVLTRGSRPPLQRGVVLRWLIIFI